MDDFVVRALVAGFGVAAVAGPLGCFVVWRRMAYFGDALAHASLLGVALGLALGLDLTIGIIGVAVASALMLAGLQRQRTLAGDTLLGILAHSALALAMVALAFIEGARVDLMAYLFGDILAVSVRDLDWIWGGAVVALALLAVLWRPLLAITVHEELARVEGVRVGLAQLGFMLLIALVIAVALKLVGVLLVTSLLIIPAAAARRLARTPEGMAGLAAALGALAVAGGLWASLEWDTPSGPSVVMAAAAIFAALWLLPLGRRGRVRGG